MSITNISMYNECKAYLAKLTYEISLLSIIQKSLLPKSLTMRIRSRVTLSLPVHAVRGESRPVRGAFTALA